jgi:hypothetical protein
MPRSPRKREETMRFIRKLADDPYRRRDYQDRDNAGHILEVKILNDHAITFWADHAVREIKT